MKSKFIALEFAGQKVLVERLDVKKIPLLRRSTPYKYFVITSNKLCD